MNIVPMVPKALQEDPPAMLHALAKDIEDGNTPNYSKAALVVLGEDGQYRLWSFGPGTKSKLETVGLLHMGMQIEYEVLVGDM